MIFEMFIYGLLINEYTYVFHIVNWWVVKCNTVYAVKTIVVFVCDQH